ncbi:MAG: TlpA disulfide reductase family protein [Myxococcota bacterium]|nr:TlpA disulfide reductase family protein [Myxococcota bacterium]
MVQLAIVLVVVMIVSAFQARHLISRGEAAPNFVLRDLQGVEHELEQYRGKTVLLAFMAPWCTVCGLEASNLVAVSDDDPDKVVLGLMIDYSSPAEAQAFVEEHEISFPVLLGNESVHRAYAVKSFPTLYVIDEEGAIRHAVVGYTTWAGLKLRLAL